MAFEFPINKKPPSGGFLLIGLKVKSIEFWSYLFF